MTDTDEYYEGKGCQCEARCESDCGCDVDWTPAAVYELRAECWRLKADVAEAENKIRWMRAVLEFLSTASDPINELHHLTMKGVEKIASQALSSLEVTENEEGD